MGRARRLRDHAVDLLSASLELMARRRPALAPFGEAPLAPRSEYLRLWTDARSVSYPAVDRYEQACNAALDSEWFHQLALLTQVVIKQSDICYQHGRLLYSTLVRYTRQRACHHLTVVETGTARGFSALCLAKALHDVGATGKIVTFDVLPHGVKILWNCVSDADGPRTRAELLANYAELTERYLIFHAGDSKRELAKITFPRVNLAFLDSVHTYEHVMAEFSSIGDHQAAGDIVFFDDYTPEAYPGVVEAADEICRSRGYSRHVVAAGGQRQYLIAEKK
jgi:predicted O-methyltransferase YrrM